MNESVYFNPRSHFRGVFLPEWLLVRQDISAGAKVVYARLAYHADEEEGVAWPTQELLAVETGCCRRSIQTHLKELSDARLIEAQRMGLQKANRYRFLLPESMIPDAQNRASRCANPALPDAQKRCIPKGNTNKGKENNTQGDAPNGAVKRYRTHLEACQKLYELLPDHKSSDLHAALVRWAEYCEAQRYRKFLPAGIEARAKAWAKYPAAVLCDAINASIENAWMGIFPDRVKQRPPNFMPSSTPARLPA